jgi:HSP20 family protein
MSSRKSTSWMWEHACDLMDQADRMHRQFFQVAVSGRSRAVWEPPVDVFEDAREIVVVVALPGVPAERVEVVHQAGFLVVRAERRIPFSGSGRAVRRLEIPYGHFERRIQLPPALLESGTREFLDGCLILRLRKTGHI